jgi:Lar family restriction alleviation protein
VQEVSEQTLKACPFCGSAEHPIRKGNGVGDYWLECEECGASTRLSEDGAGIEAAWNRRALLDQFGAKAEAQAVPDGWVPLRIEFEPGYPEDIAFGPQIMMDRLKKWLDAHFAMLAAAPVAESQPAASAEPVAVVGSDFQLLWTSADSIAEIVRRTGIKVGSMLYTAPQPDRVAAPYVDAAQLEAAREERIAAMARAYVQKDSRIAELEVELSEAREHYKRMRQQYLSACEDANANLYRAQDVEAECERLRKDADQPQAARDVLAERARQISAEGWTPEHDDEHVNDEIAAMACFYVMPPGARDWSAESSGYGDTFGDAIRPDGWAAKEGDRRRELIKAGALILAEIERLDRAALAEHEARKGGA